VARDDGFGFSPRRTGSSVRRSTRRGGGGSRGGEFEDFLEEFGAQTEDDEEKKTRALPRHPGSYRMGLPMGEHSRLSRYFDGDEALPASLAPHNIAALQRMLVEANLLDNPRWGFWDAASQEAYKTALHEANRSDTDIQTLLTTYQEAAAVGELEAKGPFQAPALQIRQHNKDDLRSLFRDAAVKLTGMGWSHEDVERAVNAFVAEETRIQTDAQTQMIERDRQLYETGSTDINQITEVDIRSPELFIEDEARRRDPGGFRATQVAEDYAPAFFDALGGFT
jgi:hypothetical protein